jgi:hypothetical protein
MQEDSKNADKFIIDAYFKKIMDYRSKIIQLVCSKLMLPLSV